MILHGDRNKCLRKVDIVTPAKARKIKEIETKITESETIQIIVFPSNSPSSHSGSDGDEGNRYRVCIGHQCSWLGRSMKAQTWWTNLEATILQLECSR